MFGLKELNGKHLIQLHPEALIYNIQSFFHSIKEGTLGTYYINGVPHPVLEDIQSYTRNSSLLLFLSMFVSLIFSITFGVFLHHWKITYVFRWMINALSIIPDFIIIILSITLAIKFYQMTNIRLITLSPLADTVNLTFPLIILCLMPSFYLFKMTNSKYEDIISAEYIRTAVGKGLSRPYINSRHVLKNLIPYLTGDIKKAISLTIGNLFIIEYLFNIRGLTIFIFSDYEFQKVVFSLLILFAIAAICYLSIKIFFILIEKVIIHE
jgi:peptide/nickel transport system permease protein